MIISYKRFKKIIKIRFNNKLLGRMRRIIKRNLVYVIGIPEEIAKIEV